MNTHALLISRLATLALLWCGLLLNAQRSTVFAQGSLTPPAAPAPTMKSLEQIEPRIDIETVAGDGSNLHIITNAGSYYLSKNIIGVSGKHCIQIVANNVTIDLNGFTIDGNGAASFGIQGPSFHTNCVVRNGVVTRCTGYGVYAFNCYGGVFERLTLSKNNYAGLACGRRARVQDCLAQENSFDGIVLGRDSVVLNCSAISNGGAGLHTYESGSRIENNHLLRNGSGVLLESCCNSVFRNSVTGNVTNHFIFPPGNDIGPVGPAATSTSPFANISF